MPTSSRALAAILGVSKSTIMRDLQQADRTTRVRGLDGKSYPASREATRRWAGAAHMLRRQDWTQARIAEHLGVSQPTVSRLLRDWRLVDAEHEERDSSDGQEGNARCADCGAPLILTEADVRAVERGLLQPLCVVCRDEAAAEDSTA